VQVQQKLFKVYKDDVREWADPERKSEVRGGKLGLGSRVTLEALRTARVQGLNRGWMERARF
jgi:hypothetical protein